MKRRNFVAAVPALLAAATASAGDAAPVAAAASGASASATAGRRYVGLALVSDKLTYFSPNRETGSLMAHVQSRSEPLPGAPGDRAALEAIAAGLAKADGSAPRSFLGGSKPAFYADQEDWFGNGRLKLPEELARAVAAENATHLLLVTKIRGDTAHLVEGQVQFGHGRILGLGVYCSEELLAGVPDGTIARGYFVPFAYVRVSLVELATSRIVAFEDVEYSVMSTGAVSIAILMDKIDDGLAHGIGAAIPRLVAAR